jgi:hypothetical protein
VYAYSLAARAARGFTKTDNKLQETDVSDFSGPEFRSALFGQEFFKIDDHFSGARSCSGEGLTEAAVRGNVITEENSVEKKQGVPV